PGASPPASNASPPPANAGAQQNAKPAAQPSPQTPAAAPPAQNASASPPTPPVSAHPPQMARLRPRTLQRNKAPNLARNHLLPLRLLPRHHKLPQPLCPLRHLPTPRRPTPPPGIINISMRRAV